MSTNAQKAIEKHATAIKQLRETQFTQDLIDVLQDKKHTTEDIAVACKAYYENFLKTNRESFLAKAREEKKNKRKQAKTMKTALASPPQ